VSHIDVDLVGHEQIQKPVAVVIDKGKAGAEPDTFVQKPGLGCYIRKGSVAVVVVELVLSVVVTKRSSNPLLL
jgi:hypothetical protein